MLRASSLDLKSCKSSAHLEAEVSQALSTQSWVFGKAGGMELAWSTWNNLQRRKMAEKERKKKFIQLG